MTSRQQIKDLFIAELLNTPEYQIVLRVRQLILDQIAAPNIQRHVVYNFEQPLTTEGVEVLKMCFLVEFGYLLNNVSQFSLVVDMIRFLINE